MVLLGTLYFVDEALWHSIVWRFIHCIVASCPCPFHLLCLIFTSHSPQTLSQPLKSQTWTQNMHFPTQNRWTLVMTTLPIIHCTTLNKHFASHTYQNSNWRQVPPVNSYSHSAIQQKDSVSVQTLQSNSLPHLFFLGFDPAWFSVLLIFLELSMFDQIVWPLLVLWILSLPLDFVLLSDFTK